MFNVTSSFKHEIYNDVISKVFPKLITNEKRLLCEYLTNLINYISFYFNFELDYNETHDNNKFKHQFCQNEYNDVTAIMMLLLPYIDDPNDIKKKQITNLSDIYAKKEETVDVNKKSPKYTYSNVQYNRCVRDEVVKEREITYLDVEQNYILLKETIIRIANKLFVNWSDILPIPLNNYKNTKLYKETKLLHENKKFANIEYININDTKSHVYCLYIGHIYDILRNALYNHVVNHRWLLYETKIRGDIVTMFTLLNDVFEFNLKVTDWENVEHENKQNFMRIYNKLLKSCVDNSDFSENNIMFDGNVARLLITLLAFYFNNHYTKRHMIKYIELYVKENEDIIYKSREIEFKKVYATINSINIRDIYNFILESYDVFKGTWYMLYFTNDTKIMSTEEAANKMRNKKYTPKNVYNYAKSLSHYNKNNMFENYADYWSMMQEKTRDVIIERLNDDNNSKKWFDISNNLKHLYKIKDNEIIKNINETVFESVRNDIIDIVFETLIINGSLSQFCPKKYLSDDKEKEQYSSRLTKTLITDDYDYGYNFTTNTPYKDCIVKIMKNNKEVSIKYVDYIKSEKSNLTKIATLNWINQLLFFHKYMNNRVIFVTGGTGVGKSSQVPKLALYALKNIDYKYSGRVICSQPTISSTISGALNISNELGVQINKTIKNDNSGNSENFTVQYEYKEKKLSHITKKKEYSLKFCTDGILYKNVENSPILLEKDLTNGDEYSIKNIYDIVMVDESHTHNLNMDVILTMMRYAVYYNNTIKLFIISATMDDDEPYYRRYYRDVNDNKMYPLNVMLESNNLDRIVVDRRYHVGTKLRFPIEEYYYENSDAHDIIAKILTTSTSGDILLFQTGAMEINNSIKEINKRTPDYVLAIPLYGAMKEEEKNKIIKFDNYRHKIISQKNSTFDTIEIGDKSPYLRFIIVATNIVEASITIDSLRFVIDNGYYKSIIYDYTISDFVTNDKTKISEQSRLQRKGRVGRVAPGTVYYMYKDGSRKNIKQSFNIVVDDIHTNYFTLLMNNRETPLFTITNNPQNNIIDVADAKYNMGLEKFVTSHYFIENKYWSYYGNKLLYDYENKKMPPQYYKTGYDSDQLIDYYGDFYIIHPEENAINRNIIGKITSLVSQISGSLYKNKYESHKIKSYWNTLIDNMFVYEHDKKYYKTEYGRNIFKLTSVLDNTFKESINYGFIISYVHSRKYKCRNFLKLMSFYYSCNFDISNIFNENTKKLNPKLIEKNQYGDSFVFLKYINEIDKVNISTDNINMTFNDLDKIIDNNVKKLEGNEKLIENINIDVNEKNNTILNIIDPRKSVLKNGFVNKYCKTYFDLKIKLNELEKKEKILSWFDKILYDKSTNDDHYNYNLCLAKGFVNKFVLNCGNKFVELRNCKNVYNVNTLTNCEKYNDYLLYITTNNENNQISFVHGMRENNVVNVINKFNKEYIESISKMQFDNTMIEKSVLLFLQTIIKNYNSKNYDEYNNYDSDNDYIKWITKCKKNKYLLFK